MKAILLSLIISFQSYAAIPHNGDDERSIRNPIALMKQSNESRQITKKMNLVLLNSVRIRGLDNELGREINELAHEIQFLNESQVDYDQQYLELLEEEVELYKQEIEYLTK